MTALWQDIRDLIVDIIKIKSTGRVWSSWSHLGLLEINISKNINMCKIPSFILNSYQKITSESFVLRDLLQPLKPPDAVENLRDLENVDLIQEDPALHIQFPCWRVKIDHNRFNFMAAISLFCQLSYFGRPVKPLFLHAVKNHVILSVLLKTRSCSPPPASI